MYLKYVDYSALYFFSVEHNFLLLCVFLFCFCYFLYPYVYVSERESIVRNCCHFVGLDIWIILYYYYITEICMHPLCCIVCEKYSHLISHWPVQLPYLILSSHLWIQRSIPVKSSYTCIYPHVFLMNLTSLDMKAVIEKLLTCETDCKDIKETN